MLEKDINELLESVHGAVKARLQLGFDKVEDKQLNLKPMIANLKVQVEKHQGPLISGKPVGVKSSKPPLATGPGFMPGAKKQLISPSEALKMQSDARSHSIGVSREGKRAPQHLQPGQKRNLVASESPQAPAAAVDFVKRLQKEKRDR
jgi:hypothetical protein